MDDQENNSNKRNKLPLQLGIGALVVLMYFGVVAYNKRNTQNQTTDATGLPASTEETNGSQATSTDSNTASTSNYKDGNYSATGSYNSPGGHEEVAVTLTLADGKITAATVSPKPATPTSTIFQSQFAENFKPFVIGKDISTLKLGKISGSSLTPKGFNDALEQIKTQAKA